MPRRSDAPRLKPDYPCLESWSGSPSYLVGDGDCPSACHRWCQRTSGGYRPRSMLSTADLATPMMDKDVPRSSPFLANRVVLKPTPCGQLGRQSLALMCQCLSMVDGVLHGVVLCA